jgi:hypothetical protein
MESASRLSALLERPGMGGIRPDVIRLLGSEMERIEAGGFTADRTRRLNTLMTKFVTSTAELKGVPRMKYFEERVVEFRTFMKNMANDPRLVVGNGRYAPQRAYNTALDGFASDMPRWRKNPGKIAEGMLKVDDKEGDIIVKHIQGLEKQTEPEWKYWLEAGKERDPATFTWKAKDQSIFKRRRDKAKELLYTMIDEAIKGPAEPFAYVHTGSHDVSLGLVRKYDMMIDGKATKIGMHLYFDYTEKGLSLRTAFMSADFTSVELQLIRRDLMIDLADVFGPEAALAGT